MTRIQKLIGIVMMCVFTVPSLADTNIEKLQAAADGEHREQKNIDRNRFRHPVETLEFFGIKDDMTVVEMFPGGGGWYTEVLAPYLRENGKLYAASFNSESEVGYFRKNSKKYLDKLAAKPGVYDRVEVFEYEQGVKPDLKPEGQADMVVTFRNTHNWIRNDIAEETFSAMFKVLKPGGVLGLVQHRGNPSMQGKEWADKGYVSEAMVLELATKAGFQLAGRSEINGNPRDMKNYEKGVWTLPPVYREGDKDRERYTMIGESDRMTLKFIKPGS